MEHFVASRPVSALLLAGVGAHGLHLKPSGRPLTCALYGEQGAISFYAHLCTGREMNFEEAYGEEITNIINVYHIAPISKKDGNYLIDPIKDIVPLCSNCHRIIHRKKDGIYLPEELRELINRNQYNRNNENQVILPNQHLCFHSS